MVQKDIGNALARLGPIAAALNDESDTLTELIEEVEAKLRKSSVGLTVWLDKPLHVKAEEPPNRSRGEVRRREEILLGFAKFSNGRWKLAIRRRGVDEGLYEGDPECPYEESFDIGEPGLLLDAPRDIRIEAIQLLPDLIDAIADKAEQAVTTIRKARKVLT